MRLVIAEKPSVARDLARVLGASTKKDAWFEGEGLRISWCIGHLAELEDPAHYDGRWKRWSFDTLPMIPEKFELRLRSGVSDHWKHLRALLKDRSTKDVVNACDAGREGELIFRYVYELSGCDRPFSRLWVSSLTDEAIQQAWARLRPGKEFDDLADAARCRSEADWLVGLNATRALTCLARNAGGEQLLSVGRVQTPTLAMIVARDREIADFVPEPYWQIKANFASGEHRWEGTWFQGPTETKERKEEEEEAAPAERLSVEAHAKAIAAATQGRTGAVVHAERKRTREQPPLLYDLTSLQRRANERYGLSAQQTLAVAQALYEKHKLITYPRTDARFITPDQIPELPKIVQGIGRLSIYQSFANDLLAHPINPGKRVVDASEVGDHHAILPTGKTPNPERLDADERRIFDLVARRFLAALSPDAVFDVTTLIVAIQPELELPADISLPLKYRSRGRVCREQGWRAVDPPGRSRDVDLPPVDTDDPALAVETKVVEGKTQPPRPYNDATLLRAMETAGKALDDAELKRAMRSAGLGTPATRADILQTLLDRKYIERKGRDLRALARGISLIAAVPIMELKSAELTGRWEARLAGIAEHKETRAKFMGDVAQHLKGMIDAIASAAPPPAEVSDKTPAPILGKCPVCGTPVREGRMAFSCETGRECSFVVFKIIAKRKISAKMVKQLITSGRTDPVKGFKSKAGKPFDAALEWKEGKVSFAFADRPERSDRTDHREEIATVVGRTCPSCKNGKIVRGKSAWGCDQWRNGCRFVIPFEREGRQISEKEAISLLS